MGVQKAVALLLGQYLAKSKKIELQIGRENRLLHNKSVMQLLMPMLPYWYFSSLKRKVLPIHISEKIQTALQG